MADFFTNNVMLIDGLKRGNASAYSILVKKYNQKLCVYAFSLTKDYGKAEDIVQEVFINIWYKRQKLKDEFNVQGFLYKSVYNQYIDLYRKEKSTMALEKKYIEALDSVIDNDDTYLEKLIALVKREIQTLPPKCKQTFILSRQDGLTNMEIAEYLNVSIKTVEAQITKAFSIIRKNINKESHGILFLLFAKLLGKK